VQTFQETSRASQTNDTVDDVDWAIRVEQQQQQLDGSNRAVSLRVSLARDRREGEGEAPYTFLQLHRAVQGSLLSLLCSTTTTDAPNGDPSAATASLLVAVVRPDKDNDEEEALWEAWENQSTEVLPFSVDRLETDADWNQCLSNANPEGRRDRNLRHRGRGRELEEVVSQIPIPSLSPLSSNTTGSSNSSFSSSLRASYRWTVLAGTGIKTRLEDRELPVVSSSSGPAASSSATGSSYYYTVWTLTYRVLQVGTVHYRLDHNEDGLTSSTQSQKEEKLESYEYEDDGDVQAGTDAYNSSAVSSEVARKNLQRSLQDRLDATIKAGTLDSWLRERLRDDDDDEAQGSSSVPRVQSSVVGDEQDTFLDEEGGSAPAGTDTSSSSSWSARKIAVSVLWGLLGLILLALIVLVWVLFRRYCRRTMVVKANSVGGTAGQQFDSYIDLDHPGADPRLEGKQEGQSVTSIASFLDLDTDPGNCWIPVPSVLRLPAAADTSSVGVLSSESTGTTLAPLWRTPSSLSRDDGEDISDDDIDSCSDMHVLELTDDDDDIDEDEERGYLFHKAEAFEADNQSLPSAATDATSTTVEIDLDTCQVVSRVRQRVRFLESESQVIVSVRSSSVLGAERCGAINATVGGASERSAATEWVPRSGEIDVGTFKTVRPAHGRMKDRPLIVRGVGEDAMPVVLNDSDETDELSLSSLSDAAGVAVADLIFPTPILEVEVAQVDDPSKTKGVVLEPKEKAFNPTDNLRLSAEVDDALQLLPFDESEASSKTMIHREPFSACSVNTPTSLISLGQGDVAAGGLEPVEHQV
jgi:hypothetical protein